MGIFSNKKEIERLKANAKVMQERNKDLYDRDIKHQEEYRANEKKYREEIAKLKLELEDTQGFLEQEKAVSTELRKERRILKRKITLLQKEMNKSAE